MIMIILKELNENVYQTFRNVTWQCQTKSLLFRHFWFLFWQTFFCYCLFWFAFTNAIILIAIHATFDWICRRIETRDHKLWFRRVWPSYPLFTQGKVKKYNALWRYLKCIWEADFRVLNETIEVLERPSIYFNSRHIIGYSKVKKAIWFSNGSTAFLLSHLKFNINDF